jgi:arginine repressor
MANQNSEVNKSQAIRDILEKNPKMPNKEIVATLAQQGIKVSDTYVYMIKGKAHTRKQKAKRQKAIQAGNESGVVNPVELIVGVRQLAAAAGGIRKLKQLVDILAE